MRRTNLHGWSKPLLSDVSLSLHNNKIRKNEFINGYYIIQKCFISFDPLLTENKLPIILFLIWNTFKLVGLNVYYQDLNSSSLFSSILSNRLIPTRDGYRTSQVQRDERYQDCIPFKFRKFYIFTQTTILLISF